MILENKYKFNFVILPVVSSIILIWLIIGGSFTINNTYQFIGLVFFLLAFFKPKYAIYLLLLFLPLFGDRPSGVQVHYLIVYSSYILFGIYINLILDKYSLKKFISKIRINNIILLFAYLFILVSFLSLIGLPILGMIKKTLSEDSLYIFKNILSVGETSLFSSVQSVFLLLQSFLFGLYIYGTSDKNKLLFYKNIILAILLGLLFSIIIGHLDFFGFYDISWYRTIDIVGSGRFHSFFINSSWYSQYLAILLPLIPIVLLFIKNTKLAIVTFILLVVLSEVTLILSMQRGAWITYPPTLLLIWVSIYYVLAKVKDTSISLNQFLKKNWFKVLITIPLTVTMSVYIVYGIKDYRKNNNISASDTFSAVSGRAGEIAKSNDRLNHWPPAFKIAQLNPIFGGGGDSFGWQYKIYYFEEGAKYKGDMTDTLKIGQWGTTHNLYLQTLTGKGIFGLIFLIGFIFVLIYMLIKKEFLSIQARSLEESVLSLVILGSLLATVIYANVQEIFYIQSVSIIFWIMLFMGISIAFEHTNKRLRNKLTRVFSYIVTLMLILLPFHIFNITYVKEYIAKFLGQENSLFDSVIWIAITVVIYTVYMQSKVIKHTNVTSLFIDDDTSDKPQMLHKAPTPRAGGIGIFFGNLFLIFNPIGWKFIVAALPAFIAGLMDDFSSLTPKTRLFMQSFSGILCVFVFESYIQSVGFGIGVNYYLAIFCTFVAVVGVINAINIIDGFNGLASGFVLMAFFSFAVVSWDTQDMVILEIAIINVAAIIGFMFFNYPKGKIFLGDGGAYFLGFAVSSIGLVMVVRHESISQWYPMAILVYPIFEVLFSMYRRKIVKKSSMTENDRLHLHQLVYYRITKSNPDTSKYMWIRVFPFIAVSTYFYDNDFALISVIACFIIYYIYLYKKLVRFKRVKRKDRMLKKKLKMND